MGTYGEHERRNPHSDCIVIGAGVAGLSAALEAARQGARVLLLSKTRAGSATCTIYAGAGFTAPLGEMTVDEHKRMTLETGRNLNIPALLEAFSEEAPSIVPFLESAGVPFRVRRGGLSIRRDPGFPLLGGKPLTDGLHRACLNEGVRFVHGVHAARLLSDDTGVSGVECVDISAGEVVIFPATSVILASGGGGALYKRTDNPQRITGDGYRLAQEAGCSLLDMEFVQFYPIGLDIPGGAHWFMDLYVIDMARVTDSSGREFLKEMLAELGISGGSQANLLARDLCSVAIAKANLKGPVLLHLEEVPRDRWRSDHHLAPIGRMFPKDYPPWSGPVPIHPTEHYFPGGVAIGVDCETGIPGLFACGEVTGGIDGANRVGGNALTNCVVFGRRAGSSAARHSKGELEHYHPTAVPPGPAAPSDQGPVDRRAANETAHATVSLEAYPPRSASAWLSGWKSSNTANARKVSPRLLRTELRDLASEYLTPLRSESGLRRAMSLLEALGEKLPRQTASTSEDLLLSWENLGLWHTAASIALPALAREESRGAHFRQDFPEENPLWLRHLFVKLEGDRIVTRA